MTTEPIECVNCGKECGNEAVIYKQFAFCCGECVCKCLGVDSDDN